MSKKAKIVIAVVAVIAVAAIAFFGIRNQMRKRAAADKNVIKIGVILPLTGNLSYEGERMKNAMDLAYMQLPEETRSLIELNYEDGKFLVRDSISAFNKLNNKGMDIWIVFGDTPLLGMKELLTKTGKPVLCLIGNQDIIRDAQYLFHFSGSITLPATKIAKYAKVNGIKNVSVIYLNEQIGKEVKKAFANTFMDDSHKIVSSEQFEMGKNDMKSIVAKAISSKPDAVFVYGYGAPYIDALNELKRANYKGIVLTDGNLSAVKTDLIEGGAGFLYADFDFGDGCTNTETKSFIDEMKNRFGVSASSFSAFAYEAIRVLSSIVKKEGKQPELIHKGLLSIKNYHSIFGIISYRENRELDIPIIIKKATKQGADVIER